MSTISALFWLVGIDSAVWRKPKVTHQPALAKRQSTAIFRPETSGFGFHALLRRCIFVCRCIVCPFLGLATMASLVASPAAADFRVCNFTKSRVGIAIGYKDGEVWATEGWWNVGVGNCEALLRGNLAARFYYIYAVDYDRGGEWSGQVFMCTRDKEFTIRGTGDCLARGFDRTGFFEVDTGEQQHTWTVQLTETGDMQQGTGKAFGPLPSAPRALQTMPQTGSPPR
jgi:uncharacterized membrane protein